MITIPGLISIRDWIPQALWTFWPGAYLIKSFEEKLKVKRMPFKTQADTNIDTTIPFTKPKVLLAKIKLL